ncbi:Testicular acid phosphatase -like protein [Trichinella patagoniensis]|uniref:acid phosphatase n=1 Tax=Trichinella patagoniensis TaxID=990121 RepID=A0A0V0ZTD5_9BILA|nr:Testicular acid phosphatase -like protein [Trichinella patagoniensis]
MLVDANIEQEDRFSKRPAITTRLSLSDAIRFVNLDHINPAQIPVTHAHSLCYSQINLYPSIHITLKELFVKQVRKRQQHNSSTNPMKTCEAIIFTAHFTFALIQCVGSSELKLIFTQVLYRHGERTPLSTYPNDPYKEDAWPNGFKQLTVEGCRQQYELGNFLRRKYSKLLSKSYKSHEIYVRSTNTSRTLASAACNLAGLYRNFQPEPIPIHTVPEEEDFVLLRTGLPCPGYDLAFKKDSRKVFSKIDEANEDFFKFVSKMSGIRDASTKSIGRLVGALEREIRNNFIMPDWIFAVWWDPTMGKYRTVYEMLYDINSVSSLEH